MACKTRPHVFLHQRELSDTNGEEKEGEKRSRENGNRDANRSGSQRGRSGVGEVESQEKGIKEEFQSNINTGFGWFREKEAPSLLDEEGSYWVVIYFL